MPKSRLLWLLLAALLSVLLHSPPTASAEKPSDRKLLEGADARIEKHRKAEAMVVVAHKSGRPVAGAQVAIRQTRHAFLFGCNIFGWGATGGDGRRPPIPAGRQQQYRQRFAALLNYATLPFYWWSYEGQRDKPRHEFTEKLAHWCRDKGIATKGHPLAWNYADPRWLPDDPDEIGRLQMARIDDCVARFKGLIDCWDVVNEATHFDRKDFASRRAPKLTAAWAKIGRVEFARQCFQHARKANPEATLLINDYRTDPAYARVIEGLVDDQRRPLYDVIGIQSHMHGGSWPNSKIWEVCERFARFGVPLHFTETTVLSGTEGWNRKAPWPSTPDGEARQARHVVRLYTMLFSHPAVEAITWWDFSDRGAWQKAPAGLVRADMTPKPAYEALLRLVKDKWWTRADLKTGGDGTAAFRGILGDYEVTVTVDGKPVASKKFTLIKDAPNRWIVDVP